VFCPFVIELVPLPAIPLNLMQQYMRSFIDLSANLLYRMFSYLMSVDKEINTQNRIILCKIEIFSALNEFLLHNNKNSVSLLI
jgi:hypothetical protein